MNLLFLNAIKGLKNKKFQMFGIIILVLLSTAIYTAMNTALDRLDERYQAYMKDQNIEDFSFDIKVDYSKDFTKEEIEELKKNELKDLSAEQMQIVNMYEQTIGLETFDKQDQLYEYIDYIFKNAGALDKKVDEKAKDAKKKYGFIYKIEKAKVATEDKKIYKAIPYDKNTKINIPFLVEGKMPETDDEITVLPGYLQKNNLEIGDIIDVLDKSYEIVGTAYAPDHIYPLISLNNPIFDEKTNVIMYMTKNTFDSFSGIVETANVAAYTDKDKDFDISEIIDMIKNDDNIEISIMTIARKARVMMLQAEIESDRTFTDYFLYLLLAIAVVIIVIITKKRIEDERLQIGVLKALGYKSIPIAISYLVYPILGALVGGTLGYFIGIYIHGPLAELFKSYFCIPLAGYEPNYKYLEISIGLPLVVLSVLTFAVALFMLRKKPLALLKEGSNLKINWITKIVSAIIRPMKFENRFKYSLAFRSFGKLLIIALTSFCSGLLIVLILIGMNLFSSMLDKTFAGMSLDNMVSYANVLNGESKTEDLVFQKSAKISKVYDREIVEKDENDETDDEENVCNDNVEYKYTERIIKKEEDEDKDKEEKVETKDEDEEKDDGKSVLQKNREKVLKQMKENDNDDSNKNMSVTLYGVESRLRYVELLQDGKNISSKLKNENKIIINYNISKIYELEVGDKIVFEDETTGKEMQFEVAGINDSFMGLVAYVNRDRLSKEYNLEHAYNVKYTKEDKYDDMDKIEKSELENITGIFSISELKENMQKQMQTVNAVIYVIIIFASFMAFIIISVVANIVVEENKKTISLMKVMGYKNKKISTIVLNIYTPFVIIAYLLSIPAMEAILKAIVKALTKDMTFAIPIEFSLLKAAIGLVGLLAAYFISIFISKKALNKVPLSIALKRE